ncbi:UNVERIFIED_CONTAM: Alpha carbonic anhydrase 7 [Sesamum angustifolium]|uniref:Alpha carbonic anhydrase 7 n=1 Tax=Sesamum angustifolium TaxID=2727405 RepID=A0AAW2N4V6_9LAMI
MSKSKCTYILAPIIVAFFVFFGTKSINAQEVDDESEFNYDENSAKGPINWGKIKEEWGACNTGIMQSPIDISRDRMVRIISHPQTTNYRPANALLKNRGHDIQIEWLDDAGSLCINGTQYSLRYAHWHSPSEHTYNGKRYALELHLVHKATDPAVENKIAVIGVFYKTGQPDPFLSKLMTNITSMARKKDDERSLGLVDPKEIQICSKRYYRYMGSLTVPPCTEGVIWTIKEKVKTVSMEQLELLRKAVHDYAEHNARPLQPHNGRHIHLYGPQSLIEL